MMPSISTLNRWARLKRPGSWCFPSGFGESTSRPCCFSKASAPIEGLVHCDPDHGSGSPLLILAADPRWRARGPEIGPSGCPPPRELLGLPGHLADAEDDELRRLHRSDADLADHLAGIDYFRRVGLGIALDVERLLRRLAHQRARVVDAQQEGRDVPGDPLPERLVVGLEDHPLRADLDRLLDHQEQTADVDVPPR